MLSNAQPIILTDSQIVEITQRHYGFTPEILRLPGEYDCNARLKHPDGSLYVLKVMHPDRPRDFIDMQIAALMHVAVHAPQIPIQRVIPQISGDLWTFTTVSAAPQIVWMLSYIEGTLFADANPVDDALVGNFARLLGQLDSTLMTFSHPAAVRELEWDVMRGEWIADYEHAFATDAERVLVNSLRQRFSRSVSLHGDHIRQSIIHGDANDYNVVVGAPGYDCRTVKGLLDFGDMMRTATVSELAIAAAYAMMRHPHPVDALMVMVQQYHAENPLNQAEMAVFFDLVCMRLCISVTVSAIRKRERPNDAYMVVSEAPAWRLLHILAKQHPRMIHYRIRSACGVSPVPQHDRVVGWIEQQSTAPVLGRHLEPDQTAILDMSVGSLLLGANPRNAVMPRFENIINDYTNGRFGLGRYLEPRMIYTADQFGASEAFSAERRTLHLGVDFMGPVGTPVHAVLPGRVHILEYLPADLDYGYLVVLEHTTDDGDTFYTLYGHLSDESMCTLKVGQRVKLGQRIGSFGAPDVNGKWPSHLHFQIILDLIDMGRDFPGVGYVSQQRVWASLSPDPNIVLRMVPNPFSYPQQPFERTLEERYESIGRNVRVSYQRPLKIVRGWRQYLYDSTGRAYIDAYNNVAHVGHCHPRVVKAATAQYALLNTNTRYLNDQLVQYARRLSALLPAGLDVCYFVNSASEANELAIRLMRAYTGRTDTIVLDSAYHGHTNTLIDISPYKHRGPGGSGAPEWVHTVLTPDDYRGPYKRSDKSAGIKYAEQVQSVIQEVQAKSRGLGGYIAETLPSVGGQIVLPDRYLAETYRYVRAAGGICIADEVQVGFGRTGKHFWAFEAHGVVPDIVVMGKPIGNGQPLAAVVTTRAIAEAFDNGMEYFSTFGGNNVSVAAGLAVLDVLRDERLQDNAYIVGERLLSGLRAIASKHDLIGDVRGAGLFVGVELVRNRETLEPADSEATYLSNRLRDLGILTGIDGPLRNVLKIRPPMPFDAANADYLLECVDRVMGEDFVRR
jgi:4-aminobutyrate aminotransferase-like enzyme/Ser/Thr protein kinase RdoA (MazF antagonist)